jgi:hypothetical protein
MDATLGIERRAPGTASQAQEISGRLTRQMIGEIWPRLTHTFLPLCRQPIAITEVIERRADIMAPIYHRAARRVRWRIDDCKNDSLENSHGQETEANGRRVKVKSRSPASSRLSATARCLSRHLRMKALRRLLPPSLYSGSIPMEAQCYAILECKNISLIATMCSLLTYFPG